MKSLEVNLKDLLLYSYATNCHLDGYSVAKAELDLIPTFSTSELLENFKELILDLLNFKKFQKEGKGNDSVVQAMACKHQSEIQHYLKVQKELKNLLENSVLREEKLLKSHEYALSRIKDLELYNESLENSDKKNNWELIKKELSEKIIDLNQKIDQRDQILTKLESENSRLKSMLEEKFIEIEIIKKNMKKKLSKGKDGKSSISIEIAKKHLEEKALELVQNQQKIRERINGQVLREKNRENRKSYNSQDFSNLVVHPLDMKFSKHHKRMIIKHKENNSVLQSLREFMVLLDWAQNRGVFFSEKLHYPCTFSPGYFGTVALDDIAPGELLVSVPNSLIMSHKLNNPPELQKLFSENQEFFSLSKQENQEYRMMAFIIFEISKGQNSDWAVYFAAWPKHVETIADWREVELIHLQDSDFVNDAMIRKDWNYGICKDLSQVFLKYPELFLPELVTVNKLIWCWNIMTTRCFGGGLPFSSLIPLADFLNHSNSPTVYYYGKSSDPAPDSISTSEEDLDDDLIDESDCIKLTLSKLHKINLMAYPESEEMKKLSDELLSLIRQNEKLPVKSEKVSPAEESEENFFQIRTSRTEKHEKGAQVTISYGNYSNRMLLTNYGFAIPNNIYDYARIKFPLKLLLKDKQFEKLSEKYDNPLCIAFKFKSNSVNLEFLEVIRGILWTPLMPVEAFILPRCWELEVDVVNYALELLSTQLEESETTLQEDQELLKTTQAHRMYFSVIFNQLLYRIGVKTCLIGQIKLLKLLLKVIELTSEGLNLKSCELEDGKPYSDLETFWEGLEKYAKLINFSNS